MKGFLTHVPGFRTNKRWKKIVAIIGYFFMIITLFTSTGVTVGDKILTLLQSVLLIYVPFILITNVGNVRNKLPLYKSKKKNRTIVGVSLTVIIVSTIIAILPQLYSPQYKHEQLIAAAKEKADAKIKTDAKNIDDAKLLADTKEKDDAKIKVANKLKADAKVKADAKIIADAKIKAANKIKDDAKVIADAKIKAANKLKADAKAKVDAKIKADRSEERRVGKSVRRV